MAAVRQKSNTTTLVVGAVLIAVLSGIIGYKLGTSEMAVRQMLTQKYSALLLAPIVNSHNAQHFFSYERAALMGWKEDQASKSSFVFKSSDMRYDPDTAQLAEGSYINISNNTLVDEKKFRDAVSELASNAGADASALEESSVDGRTMLGYRYQAGSDKVGYMYHVTKGGLLWGISLVSANAETFERDFPAFKEFASSFTFK